VEVLRGGVPAELGGAALGGAVNFVTRIGPLATGETTTLTLAGGSFGARRVRATHGDTFGADDALATGVSVAYAGASGDFDYFDDNGTPFNRDDDAVRERQNNGFDAVDVAARAQRRGALQITGGARLAWKGQGVPGPTGARATMPELGTLRVVADAGVERRGLLGGAASAGARGFAIVERQRYRDPAAEINLTPTDLSFTTRGAGLALTGALAPSARHRLTAGLDGRAELLARDDERDPAAEGATGRRLGVGAGLAWELVLGAGEEIVVVPAARVDVLSTRGDGAPSTVFGGRPLDARDDVYLTPRIAARWRLADGVALKGNAGRYFRPPTVIELFGDRGFVAGNPGLRPEIGTSGDLGVVLAPSRAYGPFDQLYLEAALFGSLVEDLILFLPTAARSARAGNVSDARLGGVEAAAHVRVLGTVSLTGNYTFLESAQRSDSVAVDGKRLPGRPRHELYLRLDVARRLGASRVTAGGFADLTLVSGNFLDEGNLNQVPPRRLVGLGARLSPLPGLTLVAQVKNLGNHQVEEVGAPGREVPRAVADVLDFPLPGRAFYLSLDLSF
jgi:iron complex outermembrane receptor protein